MIKMIRKFFAFSFFMTAVALNGLISQGFAENAIEEHVSSKQQLSDEELLENAKKMEKIISDGIKKIGIPGATLAISRGDKPLYFKAFGKNTIPSRNPSDVDEKTLFPVSSITKNVTGILVGALVDDGKISFDDKVRKYYPEFFMSTEELSNEFTIRDLISFGSGFKHFSADTLLKGGYDNQKILRTFRYLKQIPGEFRKHYGYQNVVFGIIGIVLERATGEKYEDLVQKYIFDKMEMKNSSAIRVDAEASKIGYFKYLLSRFSHDKSKFGFFKTCWNLIAKTLAHKSKQIAHSHSRHIDEIIPLEHNGFYQKFAATSGVSLSAEDFAKWLAMLANHGSFNGKQIVSKETFDELTSDIVDIKNLKDDDVTFVKSRLSREDLHYGMGFFNAKYSDNRQNPRKIWFHMGGIYGASAFLAVCPKEDIAVGVACNFGGTAHTLFCEYMVNQFLDLSFGFSKIDWVQKDIDRQLNFREKQRSYKKHLSDKNPTPMERLEEYAGTYTSEIYGDIKVSIDGKDLVISNGIRKAKLRHVNGSLFVFSSMDMMLSFFDEDEYISFFKDENGRIDSFYISCFDENKTVFKKK